MRFVHLADIHIYTTRGKHSFNWDYFDNVVNELLNLKPEFILISGDFFDKSIIDPEDLLKTIEILKKIKNKKIPVFTIEGNHDFNNTGRSIYDLLSNLGLINNLSSGDRIPYLKDTYESEFVKFKEVLFGGKKFYFASAEVNDTKIEGLAYIRDKNLLSKYLNLYKEGDILMMHQSVEGFKNFSFEGEVNINNLVGKNYKYFALGHIHDHNIELLNTKYFVYSGSIDFYSENEWSKFEWYEKKKFIEKKKGFILYDDESEEKVKFISTNQNKPIKAKIFFNSPEELEKKLIELKKLNPTKLSLKLDSHANIKTSVIENLIYHYFDKETISSVIFPVFQEEEADVKFKENNYFEDLVLRFENYLLAKTNKQQTLERIKYELFRTFKEEILKEDLSTINELKNKLKEVKKEMNEFIEDKNKNNKKGIFKFLKNN